MAITGGDFTLVDSSTGILLAVDTTVIVPEVLGGLGYDLLTDTDAAIEYGSTQGVLLENPGVDGIPVTELESEPRGYLAIDTDSGYVADAADLVLIQLSEDEDLDADEARDRAESGTIPVAPTSVRDLEGLPFESVTN